MSAPADGSSTVAKIVADLRPSADGSAAMGQTDRRTQADGRIALFQNAPYMVGHNKHLQTQIPISLSEVDMGWSIHCWIGLIGLDCGQ